MYLYYIFFSINYYFRLVFLCIKLFISFLLLYSPNNQILYSFILWAEPCPSKRYVEILPSCELEYDLICKLNLYRDHKVKMMSFKWALIQYDCCLYKKEIQQQTETHRGKNMNTKGRMSCGGKVEIGEMHQQLRNSGPTNKFSETARETWTDSPSHPPKPAVPTS